jgi:hypothetical protein
VPAELRGVAGDHHDMSRPDGNFLLAAGAHVGLARLRWVDAADVEAEGFASSGQVGDLLQFLELERRACRTTPTATASGGGAVHA